MAKKRKKKAPVPSGPRRPAHWENRVSAAYLRLISATQKEAAKAVGVNERTVRDWEKQKNWPDAQAEARSKWLKGCDLLAMTAIHRGLKADDQGTARWWAGKRIKELGGSSGTRQPPPTRPGDYGIVLSAEQLRGMSDEQLDALESALAQGSSVGPGGDAEPDTG